MSFLVSSFVIYVYAFISFAFAMCVSLVMYLVRDVCIYLFVIHCLFISSVIYVLRYFFV